MVVAKLPLPEPVTGPVRVIVGATVRGTVLVEVIEVPLKYICSRRVKDWRYEKEKDKIMTALFLCRYLWGRPEPKDDIEEVRWFKVEELNANGNWKQRLVSEHVHLFESLMAHIQRNQQERKESIFDVVNTKDNDAFEAVLNMVSKRYQLEPGEMIEIRNLYKSFGPLKVIEGLDLSVEAGKITSIMGPSGGDG